MLKIVLSSTNQAKKEAVTNILQKLFSDFELICIDVDSSVSATPFSATECIQGCLNRVNSAKLIQSKADFWIGAEGGLNKFGEYYFLGGWVLVETSAGKQSWGSSSWVQIPENVIKNLSPDKKLNEVLDYSEFDSELIKNKAVLGTNGLLTKGVYTRIDEFQDALKIAFSQI